MERNNLIKKGVVVAVIVLFVSVSVIPSTGTVVEKKSIMPTFYDGNTLYVGGNGTGNYSTIQAAIDDADWGDTVFVYDDSSPYYEHVIIDKKIQLIGEEKNTTIIDGEGTGDIIIIGEYAWGTSITGFTIQNSGNDGLDDVAIEIRADGALITNNIIVDNPGVGIYCNNWDYWSEWNTISGNIIMNNDYGIFVDFSLNNEIYDNYVRYNRFGIEIGMSQGIELKENFLSDEFFNNVYQNTITNNVCGVLLEPSWYAYIYDNNITNNGNGVEINALPHLSCKYNYIYQNNITNNNDGVIILGSFWWSPAEYNYVYQNNFIENVDHATDYGKYNKWDNGSVGNYWDDYNGFDFNGDGIGDIPYKISKHDRDNYPLMGPWPDVESYQQSNNMWFLRWLERFPRLQWLLEALGWYMV